MRHRDIALVDLASRGVKANETRPAASVACPRQSCAPSMRHFACTLRCDAFHRHSSRMTPGLAPCGRRNSCPGKYSYVPDMPADHGNADIYIDSNGCPTERIRVGGQEIVVHYDDIPESDITTVRGLRCTTPIRTVIDIAPETPTADLERIIRDCLDRGLFTVEEALARIDQPDMAARVGAHMVRSALPT
jgi:hypothetical protein